jgi:hypothetical protein
MRAVLALLLMPALLVGISCLSPKPPPPTSDLAITVPWPDQEQSHYVLLDRKSNEQMGEGTLSVTKQDGQYEMRQTFVGSEKHPGTDISTVDVDAETLKPISFHRKQDLPNQTQEVKGDYDYIKGIANITEVTGGKDRPVPLRLPNNYYDNDTAVFLWRTIPFVEGYTTAYRTVLTGSASQAVVQLKVLGKEEVTVPAGTYQAWKLEIRSSGVKQFAWFADTPQRPLVQYNNSFQLFQLTGQP